MNDNLQVIETNNQRVLTTACHLPADRAGSGVGNRQAASCIT